MIRYAHLVTAALGRRKLRTGYTMASILVAFLLFGMLTAVRMAFESPPDFAGAERLITTGRYSLTQVLPYSYWQRARGVPGIEDVTFQNWFGGIYQDGREFFPQFPTDPESFFKVYDEIKISADQKQAFLSTRTGAIVPLMLAEKHGWKVGNKLPIQATIWPLEDGSNNWEFDIVGIFDTHDPDARAQWQAMVFQHAYFDEARQFAKGTIGWMTARLDGSRSAAEVARDIDALFANSPAETKTSTEKAFNQGFAQQMGDIGMIMRSILGAVFFTLLFLTGNTMMQSVRERVPELAILKTLGYSGPLLLGLILAESLVICLVSAFIGIGIASFLAPGLAQSMPFLTGMEVGPMVYLQGTGLAVLLALITGVPPALRALRLDIATALMEH